MNIITQRKPGSTVLLMGNEAIARGVLEAGAKICAAYPGNPSSEIIETLAKVADEMGLHVEWSVNEKVALEVAAAASFGGVRGFCAMKQNGINVCSDFLASLNLTGCEGGLVLAVADDPGGHSSSNEEDSRYYAKITELPLLEPATFQEAKDMTRWAFELSETLGLPVILRSSTRISHARGNVRLDELKEYHAKPRFDTTRLWIPLPVVAKHKTLHEKINRAEKIFNESGFNIYRGPATPELLIITCGTGWMYSLEAISNLDVEDRVGILKLATTWPLPTSFLLKHIQQPELILFLEEPSPFLEENVKSLYAQNSIHLKQKRFFGKKSGDLQRVLH
jgi:indolepyruvate ferredoxin oxidoreductase alpha subunit